MISDLYVELATMLPGRSGRLYRNGLLEKHGVSRRAGVRDTTAAFSSDADPIVCHLKELGVFTGVDDQGRAYFERREEAAEKN